LYEVYRTPCDVRYFPSKRVTAFTNHSVCSIRKQRANCAGSGKRSLINVWFEPTLVRRCESHLANK
jgi:hypothetical protein